MCEFCIKHGEGKKWYLNVKNYSNDLLNNLERKKLIKDFFYWTDKTYKKYFSLLKSLPVDISLIGSTVKKAIKHFFISEHWGQIVPIEDVESILSITNSITRIPCICRKIATGKEIRTCFLISLNPGAIGMAEIVDQSFFGGPDVAKFEKMNKKDVLNFMREQEKEGAFHSIWTFKTPFVGALCNCDNTNCIAMKMNIAKAPIFFRAEYIIMLDKARCNGCKLCISICPFRALEYDISVRKVKINYKRCFGCGICRAVCKQGAMTLENREHISEVSTLW